jgi:hypothetical protein
LRQQQEQEQQQQQQQQQDMLGLHNEASVSVHAELQAAQSR